MKRPTNQLALDAMLANCDAQARAISRIVARYRATRAPLTPEQRQRAEAQVIIRRPKYTISVLPTACQWCGSDLVPHHTGGFVCRNHDELVNDAAPGSLQILRDVDLTEGEREEYEATVRAVREAWRRREARAAADVVAEMATKGVRS